MYYIAYGSNLNRGQMAVRCPNSTIVGKGYITGWKLYFDVHANIVCTNNLKDFVPVLIWDIADEDWEILDKYEGYPKYYKLGEIDTIFLDDNGQCTHIEKCLAYIMNKDLDFAFPDEYYLEIITRGYKQNNLPISVLTDALNFTSEGIVTKCTKSYLWSNKSDKKNKK